MYVLPGLDTHNHQKDKIAYVPLNPGANYLYTADLNTRFRVG